MGEIADLGAGALDDLAVGGDQQVQLRRERRDFGGEFPGDPVGLSAPHRHHVAAQRQQRAQAIARLRRHGRDQQQGEREEGDAQRPVELADLPLDARRGRGDLHDIAPLVAGVDLALQHAQRLVLRSGDLAAPAPRRIRLDRIGQTGEIGGEQRPRGANLRRHGFRPW